MSALIDWIEDLNTRDTRVRAVLRRSLGFEPGTYVAAFPYVEPFVGGSGGWDNTWRRRMSYLVAGLWALHRREGRAESVSFPRAVAAHFARTGSASTERRFINLLDADADQLPHRLRQMVSLLKEQEIDFDALLTGLLRWNDDQKQTQTRWAREFYHEMSAQEADDSLSNNGDLP